MTKQRDWDLLLWLPVIPGLIAPLFLTVNWPEGLDADVAWRLLGLSPILGFPPYCICFHRKKKGGPLLPALFYFFLSLFPVLSGIEMIWEICERFGLSFSQQVPFTLAAFLYFLPMALFSAVVYHIFARHRKD